MTRIGTSDLDVAPLALGGNVFGWTADEATSHQVLDAFVAGGGSLVDTADVYSAFAPGNSGGESETIIGSWLDKDPARRDRIVLATKVSQHPQFRGLAADTVARAARASLQRLRTDRIDLYWAHADDPETPLAETAEAFDLLVREGLVGAIGLSNYSAARTQEWDDLALAHGWARPVALQPHYNLLHRAEVEAELIPLAQERDLALIPYFALAAGFLTGKYRTAADLAGVDRERSVTGYFSEQSLAVVDVLADIAASHDVAIASVALAWLAARPSVVAPIASARNLAQLPALLTSIRLELTADEVTALDQVSATVTA